MLNENQINAGENQINLNLDLANRLKEAIEDRDLDLVNTLLNQNANPNAINNSGYTALGWLAVMALEIIPSEHYPHKDYHQNQNNMLKALIGHGADINQLIPAVQATPLMILASKYLRSDFQLKHTLYSLIIDYVQSGADPHVIITQEYIDQFRDDNVAPGNSIYDFAMNSDQGLGQVMDGLFAPKVIGDIGS